MRRLFLLFGVCLVVVLMIAPAAGAQSSVGQAAIAAGAPLPPVYMVEADGTVINEGDVVIDCSSFLSGYQQGLQEQAQEDALTVADKYRQLGFPSGDSTIGNSDVVLSLGTTGPPTPSTGGEVLPDTGGIPLAFVAALAGSFALTSFGGLMLKRVSGYR